MILRYIIDIDTDSDISTSSVRSCHTFTDELKLLNNNNGNKTDNV